eukprot:COSAG05_NODE_2582_length_2873_cov_305.547387_2_plen_207_part_00
MVRWVLDHKGGIQHLLHRTDLTLCGILQGLSREPGHLYLWRWWKWVADLPRFKRLCVQFYTRAKKCFCRRGSWYLVKIWVERTHPKGPPHAYDASYVIQASVHTSSNQVCAPRKRHQSTTSCSVNSIQSRRFSIIVAKNEINKSVKTYAPMHWRNLKNIATLCGTGVVEGFTPCCRMKPIWACKARTFCREAEKIICTAAQRYELL